MIILSGSCSPVTDRQIGWALEHGFADVPIDISEICNLEAVDTDSREARSARIYRGT